MSTRLPRMIRALVRPCALLTVAQLATACGAAGSTSAGTLDTHPIASIAVEDSGAASGGERAAVDVVAPPTQIWVDGDHVVVRAGTSVSVFSTVGGAPIWNATDAALSADRRTAAMAVVDGASTEVRSLDVATGAISAAVLVPEPLQVAALSAHGQRVALVDPLDLDPATAMPRDHRTSRVVVVDFDRGQVTYSFDLNGNYLPEAVDANNGLSIIEHVPAEAPERYRVRRLDLATGIIGDIVTRDKAALVDEMAGYGRASVPATDGTSLFTLYRDAERWGTAFIHQLDGEGLLAFCVDLPEVGFGAQSTLALSPDNRALYVAGNDGAIAVFTSPIDPFGPIALREELRLPGVFGPPGGLAVTDSSVWLLTAGELITLSIDNGAVTSRQAVGFGLEGVGVSADDGRVVLGEADRITLA